MRALDRAGAHPDLIPVREAARLASVAPVTIYRAIQRGEVEGEAAGPCGLTDSGSWRGSSAIGSRRHEPQDRGEKKDATGQPIDESAIYELLDGASLSTR